MIDEIPIPEILPPSARSNFTLIDERSIPEILPPSEDRIFHVVFTKEIGALSEILSDVLERNLNSIEIRNSVMSIDTRDGKQGIYDINCSVYDDLSQIDVEMQSAHLKGDNQANKHQGMRNRSEFYVSSLHAGQAGRGIHYQHLYRSYQITFTKYSIFEWDDRELVEIFTYKDQNNHPINGLTSMIFIDLSCANQIISEKKTVDKMTEVEKWVVFLDKASDPNYRDIINGLIENKEGIKMASSALLMISKDERERADYLSRLRWQMDRDNEIAVAKEESDLYWLAVVTKKDEALLEKDTVISEQAALIAKFLAANSSDQ